MSELKVVGESTVPTGPHTLKPAATQAELATFVAGVRRTVSADKPPTSAQANVVTVQPGGQTFSTITDALNSITNASKSRQYVVYIGPGTFKEVVTCKSWVFLSGSGPDQTIVTAPAQSTQIAKGTVRAASNSALQNCAVQATSGPWGAWTVAVDCQSVTNFDIENCQLSATDLTNGTNLVGLSLDYASGASGSQVNVSYTTVTASGGAMPIALFAVSGSYAHGMESKFVSENGSASGWGGCAYNASTILVENCYVQGAAYSLNLDPSSKVTANQCQLDGPVAPGVVVNS
jgi:hypothetical protein